jgi:hypothetical protein
VVQVRTLNTALKWQPGNEDIADFAEQVQQRKLRVASEFR